MTKLIGCLIFALTACANQQPTAVPFKGPPSLLVVPSSYYAHPRLPRRLSPVPLTQGLASEQEGQQTVQPPLDNKADVVEQEKLDKAAVTLHHMNQRLNERRTPYGATRFDHPESIPPVDDNE